MLTLGVSIAGATRAARPFVALTWMPGDAWAAGDAASLIVSSGLSNEQRAAADDLARDALRRDPLAVAAIRVLGQRAEDGRDQGRALRLMRMAESTSRRDARTQLWFIGHHARRDEPEEALSHFDIAMRTSRRTRADFIPLLVGLTTSRSMLPPLRARLIGRPMWFTPFMTELVNRAPSPENAVALTQGLLDPTRPDDRQQMADFIAYLVRREQFGSAWAVFTQARRTTSDGSEALRNGGFEAADEFAPFDWRLAQEADFSAFRQARPDGRGHALALIVSNGRSGSVAQQLVRLPAGTYRLRAEMGAVPTNLFDRPHVELACAGAPARQLIDASPGQAGREARVVGGDFSVPAGCPWQWLSIRIAGQSESPENAPWVDNLTIRRR